ncbi:hypothetical protein [Kitasatospora sp. NPDC051914]|uniref:hypothetical protein n=1 Tax=Kitasatospora sp. NPDC051914 TaxID=3154945 RepID=UPI0034493392
MLAPRHRICPCRTLQAYVIDTPEGLDIEVSADGTFTPVLRALVVPNPAGPTKSGCPTSTSTSGSRSKARRDHVHLVMRGCTDLAETDASFRIGGFGRDDWAFDVSYDASAFLESLQDLLHTVQQRSAFEIDLYPQGVERSLVFRFQDDTVLVGCTPRTTWVPSPTTEVCSHRELMSMCTALARDFASSLHAIGSEVSELAPFRDWRRGHFG